MKEPIPSLSEASLGPKTVAKTPSKILPAAVLVLAVGLGVFTGFYLAKLKGKGSSLQGGVVPQGKITKGSEFGSQDPKFEDTAEGVLEVGGIDGEGTHKLLREGGPSQTVYLTSSVLDLDQFTGKKVQIWGETFKAQKAGWLMDVGRVKILE